MANVFQLNHLLDALGAAAGGYAQQNRYNEQQNRYNEQQAYERQQDALLRQRQAEQDARAQAEFEWNMAQAKKAEERQQYAPWVAALSDEKMNPALRQQILANSPAPPEYAKMQPLFQSRPVPNAQVMQALGMPMPSTVGPQVDFAAEDAMSPESIQRRSSAATAAGYYGSENAPSVLNWILKGGPAPTNLAQTPREVTNAIAEKRLTMNDLKEKVRLRRQAWLDAIRYKTAQDVARFRALNSQIAAAAAGLDLSSIGVAQLPDPTQWLAGDPDTVPLDPILANSVASSDPTIAPANPTRIPGVTVRPTSTPNKSKLPAPGFNTPGGDYGDGSVFTNGLGTIAANSRANKAMDAQGKQLGIEGKKLDNSLKTKKLNEEPKPERVDMGQGLKDLAMQLGYSSEALKQAPNEVARNIGYFKRRMFVDKTGEVLNAAEVRKRVAEVNAKYAGASPKAPARPAKRLSRFSPTTENQLLEVARATSKTKGAFIKAIKSQNPNFNVAELGKIYDAAKRR